MVTCGGAARPRTSWARSATRSLPHGSYLWPVEGHNVVTMSASEKTIHPHLHQHAPRHPLTCIPCGFDCMRRIVSLRSERYKSHQATETLNARAFARRGNCALGTQPPNPRAPPNTAPHLRSAGVVVVGLAASPAASAPIGHAAPPAAGAKGRPRQSKARRGLASFLKFEMTIMALSDDASHNVA